MSDSNKKWVTNLHTEPKEFALESGGFVMLQPGESKQFAMLSPESPSHIGEIHAGLFSVSDKEPKAPAPAPAAPEVAVTKSAEVAEALHSPPKPPEK